MDWFYNKVRAEFDVKQIEDLAVQLESSEIKSSWLGRKVVAQQEDLSPKIKAVLKHIKANLGSLQGESRTHAITILTKLDRLYNTAGKVGWFNPTGKAAQLLKGKLEQQGLLDLCHQKCLQVSNEPTQDDRPRQLIKVFKKLLVCKDPNQRFLLKQQMIRIVYGSFNEDLLTDKAFVEKVWGKIRDALCIQGHPFFRSLRKKPQVIVSVKKEEAKEIYRQISELSRNQTPKKMELDGGIEVQVPGDFEDSIERTVFKQIDNIAGFYDQLDPKVKEKVSQADLAFLPRKELSNVFLLDLRAKLGLKRECLIEPLLVSIEQACDNYGFGELTKEMNKQFKGEMYHTPEDTIRHAVRIKIPKDENEPVEASIRSDYPMRIKDLRDQSGIIRKFTPMEVTAALTLKFTVPQKTTTGRSDYCEEVSLVVSQLKDPINEKEYLIASV